jgi:hypothetical protein
MFQLFLQVLEKGSLNGCPVEVARGVLKTEQSKRKSAIWEL